MGLRLMTLRTGIKYASSSVFSRMCTGNWAVRARIACTLSGRPSVLHERVSDAAGLPKELGEPSADSSG